MVLVPWGIGYFALGVGRIKKSAAPGFAFGLGYILMWAAFQLIAVPVVLRAGKFRQVELIFEAACLTFAIAGALLFMLQLKGGLWEKSVAYADGDDAYYIPISTAANLGGGMYAVDSYTGAPTTLDMRHGLAPFPIWVSFIAAKCGVNAAVAAHSLMPLVLIPVTYVLYLEIGKLLCRDVVPGKEGRALAGQNILLPVFMIFVSLLQIWGNYSIYPASTFLLTRTRQGKAALGNVILPFLLLLLYQMAEEIKEREKAGMQNVLWMMAAMTAGCLCSTMAGFLCGLLVVMTAGLLFILYRKPHILWQGILGCTPGIVYSLLYLYLK